MVCGEAFLVGNFMTGYTYGRFFPQQELQRLRWTATGLFIALKKSSNEFDNNPPPTPNHETAII